MSRSLGPRLPPALADALSQRDLAARAGRVLPLVTVDEAGRPHPMLCSYLEVLAHDDRTIRVVIGAASGSARNLAARGAATLLLVEPGRTVYVKGRAAGPPLTEGGLARFTLAVEDVLEDAAAEHEGGAAITGGITYAPPLPLDHPGAQAVMRLLRRSG
jgi:hypothetical protein